MSTIRKNPDSIPAIAARLRAVRKVMSGSQADFARQLGISPKTWNTYETGAGRVKIDTVLLLHHKWLIDPSWVYLGIENNMPNNPPHFLMDRINEKLREELSNDNNDEGETRRNGTHR